MSLRKSLVAVVLTGVVSASAASAATQLEYRAGLSGEQETANVATITKGSVRIVFDTRLTQFAVLLTVRDGVQITAAHIHCAEAGQNGPIITTLFAGPTQDVDGTLVNETFDNSDVSTQSCGPDAFEINNVASLLAALRKDLLYINVHSGANPPGEIRGQLFDGGADALLGLVN